ncbi:TolC family protein [Adhaeribacter terreus]|uniref:TolC family protein n=1 Tax=Adhaeribacter terreus TaxID=529703 RepID=A0ABW0E7J0_9BACT
MALAVAGYLPANAQSETGTRWSLQRAVDHALQHNLQVKLSALNTEVSRINLRENRAAQLPGLSGNVNENYNAGRSIDPFTNNFVNQSIWSTGLSLNSNVTLFAGMQLKNNVQQSRINLQASEADLAKAKNDMILNIVTAYMQVLFNDELLTTAKLNLSTSQSQAVRTEKLYKAGSVAETNLLEINAQVAADELNVINAQNNKDIAELNLMQLLDLQDKSNFEVEKPVIPEPDQSVIGFNAEQVFETAQQTQPEINAATLRVRSAMKGVDVARGNYYPRLTFSGSISTGYSSARQATTVDGIIFTPSTFYTDPNGGSPTTIYTPAPNFVVSKYAFGDQFNDNISKALSLNLSIPIFNRFQARYSVQRSQVNVQNAELNLQLEKNTLRQKVEQAYADATASQKKYIAAKKQLESFEKAYKNAEIRFNNGILNSTDFNVSKNNYIKAQSDIIQAKYDYTFKLKILDFYQGKPITF